MMLQLSFIQTFVVWWFPIDFVIRRLERKKKERKKEEEEKNPKQKQVSNLMFTPSQPVRSYQDDTQTKEIKTKTKKHTKQQRQ